MFEVLKKPEQNLILNSNIDCAKQKRAKTLKVIAFK